MPLFIGREIELAEFRQYLAKKTSSLIVCQGRRRIGKSTFVREGAKAADHFIQFEGLPPRSGLGRAEQLSAFAERLAAQTKAPKVALESWPQAFQLLASVLPGAGATVVLLDEISWMAIGDPDFAGHLKAAWDNHFSAIPASCFSFAARFPLGSRKTSSTTPDLSAAAPGSLPCRRFLCPPVINFGKGNR